MLMIINCKNIATSEVTIKSFETSQISKQIHEQCERAPL